MYFFHLQIILKNFTSSKFAILSTNPHLLQIPFLYTNSTKSFLSVKQATTGRARKFGRTKGIPFSFGIRSGFLRSIVPNF